MLDGILAYALRMPDARERVAVLTDLLAFIRKRAREPGPSAAGVDTLDALDRRLAVQLAVAAGTGGPPPAG